MCVSTPCPSTLISCGGWGCGRTSPQGRGEVSQSGYPHLPRRPRLRCTLRGVPVRGRGRSGLALPPCGAQRAVPLISESRTGFGMVRGCLGRAASMAVAWPVGERCRRCEVPMTETPRACPKLVGGCLSFTRPLVWAPSVFFVFRGIVDSPRWPKLGSMTAVPPGYQGSPTSSTRARTLPFSTLNLW